MFSGNSFFNSTLHIVQSSNPNQNQARPEDGMKMRFVPLAHVANQKKKICYNFNLNTKHQMKYNCIIWMLVALEFVYGQIC